MKSGHCKKTVGLVLIVHLKHTDVSKKKVE